MYSLSKYDSVSDLVSEIIQAFNGANPLVVVEFTSQEEIKAFSQAVAGANLPHESSETDSRLLCKTATNSSSALFPASEISGFSEECFPVIIRFSNQTQLCILASEYINVDGEEYDEQKAWEQMIDEGILSAEDLDDAKALYHCVENKFPQTHIHSLSDMRELYLIIKREEEDKCTKEEALISTARLIYGVNEDDCARLSSICELEQSGAINQNELSSLLDEVLLNYRRPQ